MMCKYRKPHHTDATKVAVCNNILLRYISMMVSNRKPQNTNATKVNSYMIIMIQLQYVSEAIADSTVQ